MSTRRTRNLKFVQIGGKGAPGQIREIWGLSFFFLFFPGLAYWSDLWAVLRTMSQLRAITEGSAFLESAQWLTTFRGSKPLKLGVNMHCRASHLRINEDW